MRTVPFRIALLMLSAFALSSCALHRSTKDPQLELAKKTPGFAGFFLDDNGEPTVYLTDPSRRTEAQTALREALRSRGFSIDALRVVQAEYTYKQLNGWARKISRSVFAIPDVVSVDLDESQNRIVIGVHGPEAEAAVARRTAELGVPNGARVIEQVQPLQPYLALNERVRPALGGVRIRGAMNCTLGFNVSRVRKGGTTDRRRSFVSNSHCTTVQGVTEGTSFGQPAGSGTGTEVDDPAYFRRRCFLGFLFCGPCPRGRQCRYSDSARMTYSSSDASTLAGIARLTEFNVVDSPTGGFPVHDAIEVSGTLRIASKRTQPLVKGDIVSKVGAVSGWTIGKVKKTCADASLSGSSFTHLCQHFVAAYGEAGDSGAPVFEWDRESGTVTLDGILWGGNSESGDKAVYVFSPITGIERELGRLTVCQDCASNTPPGNKPDLVPEPLGGGGGPVAFCRRNEAGQLVVRVRNQTNATVLTPTVTRVLFSPGGKSSQSTPALSGGAAADILFSIPSGCFDSDCDFTIFVDADLQIDENHDGETSNHETNNVATGRCIG